jgi:hypothetical protein
MKTQPILFSADMVNAILQNRKTETRRIYKGGKIKFEKDQILYVREGFLKSIDSGKILYTADYSKSELFNLSKAGFRKKPSIHLPRANSRIWLKVLDVRIERLQEITRASSIKEGVEIYDHNSSEGEKHSYKNYLFPSYENRFPNPISSFKSLWKKINGNQSWYDNPEVIVVEFELNTLEDEKS